MNPAAVMIKSIVQKDNFHFTIDWSDGVSWDYKLSELQRRCPCAKCYDPESGKQLVPPSGIENVKAKQVRSVGRYGLRIQFTSGCSMGIYSYNMLRKMVGDYGKV